jgi:hypothetical protein
MKYITDENGAKYEVDFYCVIDNGKIEYSVKGAGGYKTHNTKVYYRSERTWDDHMGNTPCGYYTNVPLGNGKTKRVYIF